MGREFKLNTREFDATMRRYMEVSKRDWPTIFNTKGFFIARRATVETPKAAADEIRKLRERRVIGTGTRYRGDKARKITVRDPLSETRAARIIQAIRRNRGEPPLKKKELPEAVRKFLAYRLRSIAFLKSGWLPAIRKLDQHAEKRRVPRADRAAKKYGRDKGDAKPARPGWRCSTIIINSASTNRDKKAALQQYGGPALQRAFDAEVASMKEYIERKLRAQAKRQGIRTN